MATIHSPPITPKHTSTPRPLKKPGPASSKNVPKSKRLCPDETDQEDVEQNDTEDITIADSSLEDFEDKPNILNVKNFTSIIQFECNKMYKQFEQKFKDMLQDINVTRKNAENANSIMMDIRLQELTNIQTQNTEIINKLDNINVALLQQQQQQQIDFNELKTKNAATTEQELNHIKTNTEAIKTSLDTVITEVVKLNTRMPTATKKQSTQQAPNDNQQEISERSMEVQHTDEEIYRSVQEACNEFRRVHQHLKQDLNANSYKHTREQLQHDCENAEEFEEFRKFRTELTHWYQHSQKLLKHIIQEEQGEALSTRGRSHISIQYRPTQISHAEHEHITKEMKAAVHTANLQLALADLEQTVEQIDKIYKHMRDSKLTDFAKAKAWRQVTRSNLDYSDRQIYNKRPPQVQIPEIATYVHETRQQETRQIQRHMPLQNRNDNNHRQQQQESRPNQDHTPQQDRNTDSYRQPQQHTRRQRDHTPLQDRDDNYHRQAQQETRRQRDYTPLQEHNDYYRQQHAPKPREYYNRHYPPIENEYNRSYRTDKYNRRRRDYNVYHQRPYRETTPEYDTDLN